MFWYHLVRRLLPDKILPIALMMSYNLEWANAEAMRDDIQIWFLDVMGRHLDVRYKDVLRALFPLVDEKVQSYVRQLPHDLTLLSIQIEKKQVGCFVESQRFSSVFNALQYDLILLTGDYPLIDFTLIGRYINFVQVTIRLSLTILGCWVFLSHTNSKSLTLCRELVQVLMSPAPPL